MKHTKHILGRGFGIPFSIVVNRMDILTPNPQSRVTKIVLPFEKGIRHTCT